MKLAMSATTVFTTLGLILSGPLLAADTQKETTRTYINDHGDTVTIDKKATIDEDGNVTRRREFDISDSSGDTVATGRDRDWKDENGRHGSSQAAVKYDADGNKVLKKRQAEADGEGNLRSRKGKSVRDEDGNLIAKGIDGEASKDGTEYKSQKRTRTNADGDSVTKVRRGKVDENGNKTTVKKQSVRPRN